MSACSKKDKQKRQAEQQNRNIRVLPHTETSICCCVQRVSWDRVCRGARFSHGEAHCGELLVSCSGNGNSMVCKSLVRNSIQQLGKGMGEAERKPTGVSGGKMPLALD